MEVISVLAALLLLIIFVAMIIGLIKPSLLKNPKKPNNIPSRKEILLGGIVALVLLTVIGVATAPDIKKEAEQEKKTEQTQTKETIAEPKPEIIPEISKEPLQPVRTDANLGMTPEQFRQAFNQRLKNLDIDTIRPFGEFDVKKGDVHDVFQVNVSPDVSLTGTVNHDGMLRGITYIVIPSGDSQKAMMETLILTGLTSNIINGEENKSKTGKVVTDLLTKALDGIDKEKNTHKASVGNVEYFATASKQMGLWFSIEPAEKN
ncbi:hypothetical protein [Acinetobacter ursingii]|uniref:hypothetical protein n=1 Tax=Acinetobacter ursingii TaxID=108980 RepID=UPI003AF8879B